MENKVNKLFGDKLNFFIAKIATVENIKEAKIKKTLSEELYVSERTISNYLNYPEYKDGFKESFDKAKIFAKYNLKIQDFENTLTLEEFKKKLLKTMSKEYKHILGEKYLYVHLPNIGLNIFKLNIYQEDKKVLINAETSINDEIVDYIGEVKIFNTQLFININNENEHISFCFSSHDIKKVKIDFLIGFAIGIDNDTLFPIAKKALFTIKLNKLQQKQLKIVLNPIDIISTKDIDKKLIKEIIDNQLVSLSKSFDIIANNVNNQKKIIENILDIEETNNSSYHQIVFKEYNKFLKIFNKIKNEQDYYIEDILRASNIIISNLKQKGCKCIFHIDKIHYDIINGKTNSPSAKNRIEDYFLNNLKTSQNVLIERIFVFNENIMSLSLEESVNKLKEFLTEIKKSFENENNKKKGNFEYKLKLYFTTTKTIKESITETQYLDMTISKDELIALYVNKTDRHCYTQITKSKEEIRKLLSEYNEILKISKSNYFDI